MAVVRINDLINNSCTIMLTWGSLQPRSSYILTYCRPHYSIFSWPTMSWYELQSMSYYVIVCHHIMICYGTSCRANSWPDHDANPPHITSRGEFPHSSVLTVFYKVVVAAAVSRTSIQEITIINFENQLVFSCLVCLSSLVPVSLTKINHRMVNPYYEGTPVLETHDGCI
jgi:hypothetical protein